MLVLFSPELDLLIFSLLLISTCGASGFISPQIMAHYHWPAQGPSLVPSMYLLPFITVSQSHFPLASRVTILTYSMCILLFVCVLIKYRVILYAYILTYVNGVASYVACCFALFFIQHKLDSSGLLLIVA